MPLQYLEFDLSEDSDGWTSASALACPPPRHLPALHAEVQALLQALHAELGAPGPLDNGHRWDLDLDLQLDSADAQRLSLDALTAPWAGPGRITLSLHLAGDEGLHTLLHTWMTP